MSLMGTLAKVAIGVAVAKGAQSMLKNRDGQVGDGGLFGGQHSPKADAGRSGLEDIMSDVFSGKGSKGGLGDMLESLQTENPNTGSGGLNDLLRGGSGGSGDILGSLVKELTGGQSSGGLGGLLGSLAGAAEAGSVPKDGFGSVLNQAMRKKGEPEATPSPEQDAAAGLMLRAMIQAAKSDSKLDDAERAKLLDNLGDVSREERDFVNAEMARPVDAKGLARQVPRGLEQQVYAMSLLGIDLDNRNEANYLHELASAMGLDQQRVNHIHGKLGVPALYR